MPGRRRCGQGTPAMLPHRPGRSGRTARIGRVAACRQRRARFGLAHPELAEHRASQPWSQRDRDGQPEPGSNRHSEGTDVRVVQEIPGRQHADGLQPLLRHPGRGARNALVSDQALVDGRIRRTWGPVTVVGPSIATTASPALAASQAHPEVAVAALVPTSAVTEQTQPEASPKSRATTAPPVRHLNGGAARTTVRPRPHHSIQLATE